MQFAYTQWSWLTALAGAVVALALLTLVRKRRALRRLTQQNPDTTPLLSLSRRQQLARTAMVVLAAALLGVVLLGPQWGYTVLEAPAPANGRDVLFLLDVSRSMLAQDVTPNRLGRAKADIRDLAVGLERAGGHRVGLLTFAERAAVVCPLTFDYRCFEEELGRASLESLRLRGDTGADDGTQIGAALLRAAQAIDKRTAAFTDVVLVSDGDDMAPATLDAAQELARLGVVVHTVGLGDPTKPALIPVRGSDGRMTHLRYKGELVHTKLEETVLRAVAEKTGGRYLGVGTAYVALDAELGPILAGKAGRERTPQEQGRVGIHRFTWFLAPAVALLLLEMILGERRNAGGTARPRYFGWVRRRAAAPA
jgi:Ca-activated chloride channel family protein